MQAADSLRITVYQQDIVWENKQANREKIRHVMETYAPETDLIVLPEMCTTGFTMNSLALCETDDGDTISALRQYATRYDVAVCGSFIAAHNGECYNRAFFITPTHYCSYDKRHLFRMGDEPNYFSAGNNKLIVEHKGFHVCLLICYDLRFPVWSRNVDNEYDLLIYVANWPQSRNKVWNALLTARAIENMSYVCGVNRVGQDGNGLEYDGNSKVINARGEEISHIPLNKEVVQTVCISKVELNKFRDKFPVWKDADRFDIIKE